jgi:hypothetical protein
MKIKIMISTSFNEYSCFTWTKEKEENATDELKDLVDRFQKAEGEDQEEIAEQITSNYGEDQIDPESGFGTIDIEYPDGEHEGDLISRPDEVENDNCQFYQKKMNDPANILSICKVEQYKHGGWEGIVESKHPFNINYLSVMNGEITYGMDNLENMGGGDHNFTEFYYS